MQPTILQILNLRKAAGDVGIEVECEGRTMHVDNDVWKCEDDGSLRGVFPDTRCEYILRKPIPAKDVEPALRLLSDELLSNGCRLDFSYRTSVHVHVNVQQLNIDQVMNMAYTYLLLEEPLANFCGKQRKGCQFALRLVDAEGLMEYLGGIFEFGEDALKRIKKDAIRYAAINFEAIAKYGSIEFRGMRGSLDVPILSTWVDILVNIREFSKKHENPLALFKLFRSVGAKGFLALAVGEANVKALEYPRMEQEIQRNFSLTLDLPVRFKKLDTMRKKPKPSVIKYVVGQRLTHDEAVKFVEKYAYGYLNLKYDENNNAYYEIGKSFINEVMKEKEVKFKLNKIDIDNFANFAAAWDAPNPGEI